MENAVIWTLFCKKQGSNEKFNQILMFGIKHALYNSHENSVSGVCSRKYFLLSSGSPIERQKSHAYLKEIKIITHLYTEIVETVISRRKTIAAKC